MSDKVKPRLAKGFSDALPEQMLARQCMIDVIRGVYESYGFVPIDTPAIEYLDVLSGSGGQEAQASIFSVENPEKEDAGLALRFDLTVPLARLVAQYKDLPRPFRRYQVAPVWRNDKPGPGRFRQFMQFDLDSVGVASDVADTEIMAAMCDTLTALDVGPYSVRFSSRLVLNLLMPFAGIDEQRGPDVFRILDKLDKIGRDKVRKELTTGYRDESGAQIDGLGLSGAQVDKIESFLDIRSDRRSEVVTQLRSTLSDIAGADEQIDTVARISDRLGELGYGDDRVALDLSIARGLAYYTGPVFEAQLLEAPEYGSVFGGGRYDDLVMRFIGEQVPATGASIGVDRLIAALMATGRLKPQKSTAQVLVTTIDPDLQEDYVALTFELRRAGIPTEMYLGPPKRFGKQMKYADRCGVPITLVIGSDEKDKGVVTIKDMGAGQERSKEVTDRQAWREERPGQFEVPRLKVVEEIKALLERIQRDG